jgi:diadenylate cyclase
VKEGPLHDGAVIIDGGIIKAAGCVLPLSSDPDIDPSFGTRHRAALGLTERSDAMVVVVSEETGTITLFIDGSLYRNLDAVSLQNLLEAHASNGQRVRKGLEARVSV